MFNVSFTIVTPHTAHVGKGMARSPKLATRQAKNAAWDKLVQWDHKHKHCSSIGIEWLTMRHNGRIIASEESWS